MALEAGEIEKIQIDSKNCKLNKKLRKLVIIKVENYSKAKNIFQCFIMKT